MQVEWYGQAAFRLQAGAGEGTTVFVDPIGDVSGLAGRGLRLEYPPISGVSADLVLVTHEHSDHNGVERISGSPLVLRSTAGRFDSPAGEVVAVASEHDEAAGTERGPNTIFVFELGGIRAAHMGDFGQRGLRPQQAAAIGAVDLLMLPVGAGPTIGAEQAALVVELLRPRWVVPMHYRTRRVNFLEPADGFLARFPGCARLGGPIFDTGQLPAGGADPLVVVPAAP